MKNNYNLHTDKYLTLLEKFMLYVTTYKTDIDIPNKANIVIFDADDKEFSNYGLRVLDRLKKRNEKNIIEVTRTGSDIIPWRISKNI